MTKTFKTLLLATAVTYGLAGAGYATPITGNIGFAGGVSSITSSDGTLTGATSINFVSTLDSYGLHNSGTGVFLNIYCGTSGSCGTIQNLTSLTVGTLASPISNFFSLSGGNNSDPITFSLASLTGVDRGSPGFLNITGAGMLSYGSYDPTNAMMSLTLTQVGNQITVTDFTASTAAVPVPATGFLLLGGIGAFGALRRRKKKATA